MRPCPDSADSEWNAGSDRWVGGCRSSWSPPGIPSKTGFTDWTPERTITWSNRSISPNWRHVSEPCREGGSATTTDLVGRRSAARPGIAAGLPGRGRTRPVTEEFSLLELFMENPGVVLTRTLIIEQLWDYEYDGMSNVVDRYVGYLRRKIDRPFAQDDVQTVRGVGCLLKAPVSRYADPGPPCHCHHDRHRSCCRLRRLDLRHHLGASTSQFARRRADSPGGCCFPTVAASSSNHVVTSGRPA